MALKFDWTYLKELSGGDAEFEGEMIQIYKEEVPTELQDIEVHSLAQDWPAVGASIHKLKSKIRIVGLHQLGELAQKLENAFKRGQVDAQKIAQAQSLIHSMRSSLDIITPPS